ncbi:MAG: pirin family protein [Myxococcota bacterium]
MSSHQDPASSSPDPAVIEHVIVGRPKDLGDGFVVRRTLPSLQRRRVGPFVFFDHFGPVDMAPGTGLDVRPHPHIALSTVTYLFAGEILHRDSLGSVQVIRPGDVNWMVAGKGIVHSERTAPETRRVGQRMHGLQAWVGLPTEVEECAPAFFHHPAATLPMARGPGFEARVVAGTAFGQRSPVEVASPTLYVDVRLEAGARFEVPTEHHDRAVCVVTGPVDVGAATDLGEGAMVVLVPGQPVVVHAAQAARIMLLGGAPLHGERYLEWNFVASSKERLAQARDDWRAHRFPLVPGDGHERIPYPGDAE